MQYFLSVVIGIVSSLIATAAFVGFAELMRRVILPWYADKIYRGVRIDGRWESVRHKSTNGVVFATMELKQKGDTITGVYSHGSKEKGTCTQYQLKGILRDTYLTATAHPVTKDMIDAVTYLLRVYHGEGGLRMKGGGTCISTSDGTVKNSEEEFSKEE